MVNDFSCAAYSCLRNTDALPMKCTFPQSHKLIRMEEEKNSQPKLLHFTRDPRYYVAMCARMILHTIAAFRTL